MTFGGPRPSAGTSVTQTTDSVVWPRDAAQVGASKRSSIPTLTCGNALQGHDPHRIRRSLRFRTSACTRTHPEPRLAGYRGDSMHIRTSGCVAVPTRPHAAAQPIRWVIQDSPQTVRKMLVIVPQTARLRFGSRGVRDSRLFVGIRRVSARQSQHAFQTLAAQTLDRYHPVTFARFRTSRWGSTKRCMFALVSVPLASRRAEIQCFRTSPHG